MPPNELKVPLDAQVLHGEQTLPNEQVLHGEPQAFILHDVQRVILDESLSVEEPTPNVRQLVLVELIVPPLDGSRLSSQR